MQPTGVEGAAVTVTVDAALIQAWVAEVATAVASERDHLTALDAAIGDADHGANLDRGFGAVTAKLAAAEPAPGSPGAVCGLVGRTLISTVGGASGPLYGTAFREIGKALGDVSTVDDTAFVAALRAGLAGVQRLGAAAPGDKTMVDAYAPALAALEEAVRSGQPLATAVKSAAHAADDGARATVPLQARKGRASYLGARSVGHQDPGATSTALLFAALQRAVERPG
jgi:dihydroxyacetone kinase phosphoprotein-dependent L subunit